MNKQIKNTKKGGFIKDLQNYQKSQIIILNKIYNL